MKTIRLNSRIKQGVILAGLLCYVIAEPVWAGDWQFDRDKSTINFMTTKESFAQIKGGFQSFEGQVNGSPDDPLHTAANFIIRTGSVVTGLGIRDQVLRGSAFFNIQQYPTMEFRSTKITRIDANHATVRGDLTLLGVTKPLTFDVTLDKPVVDNTTHITTINATAVAVMDRYAWGMTTFVPAVGHDITVKVNAVLISQD